MSALSAPITELLLRLSHSKADGQLLAGFTVKDAPEPRVDGAKDFPSVALIIPDFSQPWAGGRGFRRTLLTVTIIVDTKRTAGLPEHLDNISKVLDAIELNRATPRKRDVGLAGSAVKPFGIVGRDNKTLDLAFQSSITLEIEARPVEIGNR